MSLTSLLMSEKPWIVDVSAECEILPFKVEGIFLQDAVPSRFTFRERVIIYEKTKTLARRKVERAIREFYGQDVKEIHFYNTHKYFKPFAPRQSKYVPALTAA